MVRLVFLVLVVALGACNLNPPPTPQPGTLWSNPASWANGQVPTEGADVTIPIGKSIILDQSISLKTLSVYGNLQFAEKDLSLSAGWIMVHGPGRLQIGEPNRPYTHRATITLNGDPADNPMDMGPRVLGAMMGGAIEIYGEDRVDWTKLDATAVAGSSQLILAGAVDWRVGEQIVVASTHIDPSDAEVRTITAIAPDGRSLSLNAPLNFRHYGVLQSFGGRTLDERAEVGLLSRRIVIQGDNTSPASRLGGHMMVMGADSHTRETSPSLRSILKIRGVEFRRMGHFQSLGRYPVHWHRNGPSSGDFIESSSLHDNYHRGIVVHSTDGVRVKDNVVYGSIGHSFMTEDGSETDNTFEGNLGVLTRPFETIPSDPILAAQNDSQAATFWIKGPNNRFIGNVAAGGMHSGFWFDDVGPVNAAKFEFRDNVAHSYLVGRTQGETRLGAKGAVWITGTGTDDPVHGPFKLQNLTIYKSREGYWANAEDEPTGNALVEITGAMLADNALAISSHGLRDSVVVGKSANPDPDSQVGMAGVQEYRATSYLENVQFFNFSGAATAIQSRNCSREGGNIIAENISLNNARLELCGSGNNDLAIEDRMGQLLGNGVLSTVVPSSSLALHDASCQPNPASRTHVCPGKMRYLNLTLETNLFYRNLRPPVSSAVVPTLTRADGVVLPSSDILNTPYYWSVLHGSRYTLGGNLSQWDYLRLRAESKYYSEHQNQHSAVVGVPSSVGFVASSCNLEKLQMGTACSGKTALPQVTSEAALNASSQAAYWLDGTTIYIKIFSNSSVLLERQ